MAKVARAKTIHKKSPIARRGKVRVVDVEKVFNFPPPVDHDKRDSKEFDLNLEFEQKEFEE